MPGYTHRISWKDWSSVCRVLVTKSFPTTEDAVEAHVKTLKAAGFTPVVELLPTLNRSSEKEIS